MAVSLDPVKACETLLSALQDRAPRITPQEMAKRLRGWQFFDCGGAVVMALEDEVHVAAPPERRGLWLKRADIREVLGGILARFGRARTSVMQDNSAGHMFVRRFGFERIGERGELVLYQIGGTHA